MSSTSNEKNTSKKETKTEKAKKFLTWSRIIYMAGSIIILIVLFIPWTNGEPSYPLQKGTQLVDDLSGSKEEFEEYKTNVSDNFTALVNEGLRSSEEIYQAESDYWNEYHSNKSIIKHYPADISMLEGTLMYTTDESERQILQAKIDKKKAALAEAQAYFDNLEE